MRVSTENDDTDRYSPRINIAKQSAETERQERGSEECCVSIEGYKLLIKTAQNGRRRMKGTISIWIVHNNFALSLVWLCFDYYDVIWFGGCGNSLVPLVLLDMSTCIFKDALPMLFFEDFNVVHKERCAVRYDLRDDFPFGDRIHRWLLFFVIVVILSGELLCAFDWVSSSPLFEWMLNLLQRVRWPIQRIQQMDVLPLAWRGQEHQLALHHQSWRWPRGIWPGMQAPMFRWWVAKQGNPSN